MQLLPLVEMYCRWDLQEDCSDLQALVQRFDSVSDLESHDLGRSLLRMVRDEEDGLLAYSERRHVEPSPQLGTDPFGAVRARLASVDLAFQGLQAQVHIFVGHTEKFALGSKVELRFSWHFYACPSLSVYAVGFRQLWPQFLIHKRFVDWIECLHIVVSSTSWFSDVVQDPCSRIGPSSFERRFLVWEWFVGLPNRGLSADGLHCVFACVPGCYIIAPSTHTPPSPAFKFVSYLPLIVLPFYPCAFSF